MQFLNIVTYIYICLRTFERSLAYAKPLSSPSDQYLEYMSIFLDLCLKLKNNLEFVFEFLSSTEVEVCFFLFVCFFKTFVTDSFSNITLA